MNLPQPPEGVLHPKMPWSRINPNSRLWLILKSKLTGRRQGDESYTSYVNLSDEDADRLIANIKKDPRGYPSLDQESGTPIQWMERQRLYQEWLVEAYLNNPFEEAVSEKIVEQTSEVLVEAQEEIQEAETKAEVSEILEDKIDILEDIQEKISPPPNEYQRPADPWEGSETVPKTEKKKEKKKPSRRKLKRPKNTVKKKKKPKAPSGGNEPPTPPSRRKRLGRMFGGGLKKTGSFVGKTLFSGGVSKAPGEGPSVLAFGSWIGKKVKTAFQDAKEQKERALEAQSNGADIPQEVLEPGYFIKKSIGYQFGGRAFDTTFGAFIESMPSKQSKSQAGFGDQFDYGDSDPKKKKKANEIRDLATGFKKVSIALGAINKQITKQTQTLEQLVNASERNSDLLEGILTSISKMVDVEIDSGSDEAVAQQAAGGDINIPSIDLSGLLGKSEGGLDWFDLLMAADDTRDIAKKIKGGGQRSTTRRGGPKITGDVPKRNRFKMPSFGRFGRRMKFSEGAASVRNTVPALIGEAGPEILVRSAPKKLAEGGVMQGTGSNILATGLGAAGDLMKKVQPFANVMEMPFKVIGAQISGALASIVAAAGPFSGVIAKMFSPLLGGLATLFGLNQGAFAAELDSAAMTEEQGAKELSKFFANFFKMFGINIGGDGEDGGDGGDDDDNTTSPDAGDYKELLDMIAGKESTSAGGYIAYNEGGSNNGYSVIGYSGPSDQGPIKRKLTDMTVAEIMQHQKDKDPPIHAAGRYQIIGSTMDGLINRKSYGETGVSPNDKFNASTQDKLGIALIKYRLKTGANVDNFISEWRGLKFENREKLQKAIDKAKGASTRRASKGAVQNITNNFSDQVRGLFEISGPPSGFNIPPQYTGGQPYIGHGRELLFHIGNKMVIAPIENNEYNVYKDPAKAFNRYEQIGRQAGVEVAGFVNFIDNLLAPPKTGRTPVYGEGFKPKRIYRAEDESGAEILRLLGGTPVKGASLPEIPEGQVNPIPIPKDTVSGTSVAMIQTITPVIQQVPVYIKGDTKYIHVPANPLVAAREKARLSHYTSIT